MLYEEQNWAAMVDKFEEALKEFYTALKECQTLCQGPVKLGETLDIAQVFSPFSLSCHTLANQKFYTKIAHFFKKILSFAFMSGIVLSAGCTSTLLHVSASSILSSSAHHTQCLPPPLHFSPHLLSDNQPSVHRSKEVSADVCEQAGGV